MMIRYAKMLAGAGVAVALLAGNAHAAQDAPNAELHHIKTEWARISYTVHDHGQQVDDIEALENECAKYVAAHPRDAEAVLWQGIVTSEHAAIAGVFHQLALAKKARDILKTALKLDPNGVNGEVQMSLGVLYYRVPGFPIGFGDDDTARKDLQFALSKDPNGLDTNYFYGDFLVEQGDDAQARKVLAHALDAPVDKSRPVWDAGRRAEVRKLMASIGGQSKS